MVDTTQIVTLSLVLMAVAFLFPTIIGAAYGGTATTTIELNDENNDVTTVEDAMRVEVDSQSGGTMTLQVSSLTNGDSENFTISDGDSVTVQLGNDTVTINAIRIDNNHGGLFEVTYPVDMGWTPESSQISENLPLVLAGLPLIIVIALAAKVIQ